MSSNLPVSLQHLATEPKPPSPRSSLTSLRSPSKLPSYMLSLSLRNYPCYLMNCSLSCWRMVCCVFQCLIQTWNKIVCTCSGCNQVEFLMSIQPADGWIMRRVRGPAQGSSASSQARTPSLYCGLFRSRQSIVVLRQNPSQVPLHTAHAMFPAFHKFLWDEVLFNLLPTIPKIHKWRMVVFRCGLEKQGKELKYIFF